MKIMKGPMKWVVIGVAALVAYNVITDMTKKEKGDCGCR